MSHKTINKSVIWFVLSSKRIGGAERRALNLADAIIAEYPNIEIKLMIYDSLLKEYQKDMQTKCVLERNDFLIVALQDSKEKRNSIISRAINKLVYIYENVFGYNYSKLKTHSWYNHFDNYIMPGEHIHCFAGDAARHGAIIKSFSNYYVIIEITNNRYLQNVSRKVRILLKREKSIKSLAFQSVSLTVMENFNKFIGPNLFLEKEILIDYYKTPYLSASHKSLNYKRENVIVFAHRFDEPKNGLMLAEVIAEMSRKKELTEGWRVAFYGQGSQEAKIKKVLKELTSLGLAEVGWSHTLESDLAKSKIFISIIDTGNYPSQSVFQALRAGNILILSDTGETRAHFNTDSIYFTKLTKQGLREQLIIAIKDSSDDKSFAEISIKSLELYKKIQGSSKQHAELLTLHFPSIRTN